MYLIRATLLLRALLSAVIVAALAVLVIGPLAPSLLFAAVMVTYALIFASLLAMFLQIRKEARTPESK